MVRKLCLLTVMIGALSCNESSHQEEAIKDTTQIVLSSPEQDTLTMQQSPGKSPANEDKLIIPGERIGKTILGMNAEEIEQLLGKADMSDAAMGKAWLIWYGKRDDHNNKTELDIYTTYKDSTMREKAVQQIRVTSSYFKTRDGLGVYSDEKDIKKVFAALKPAMTYTDGGRTVHVLDDVQKGIAFETVHANTSSICIGVIVHMPGKAVTDTYIYLHPDTKMVN